MFVLFAVLAIFSIVVCYVFKETKIFIPLFIFFLGIALPFLFNVIKSCFEEKENPEVLCDFQLNLHDIGILKIYSKRSMTEEKGYLYDLIEEFNKISNRRNRQKNVLIKMIGVALESYFRSRTEPTKTSEAIEKCCSLADFHVLLCDIENKELYNKYNLLDKNEKNIEGFVKELDDNNKAKYNKLSDEGKNKMRFEKMELINEIGSTVSNIDALRAIHGDSLDYYQYKDFSPYATIIFINDKIFYTPNMTIFESYYVENKKENISGIDLTFCIKRKSKAGIKLENSFDKLWNYHSSIPNPTIKINKHDA